MINLTDIFFFKARESVAGAESEFANGRYNNCANRCYYACFQAAVGALIQEGLHASRANEEWSHTFVQGQFVGELINRRKRYPSNLRDVLARTLMLRQIADYKSQSVSQTQGARAIRATRQFLQGTGAQGGEQS